MTNQEAFNKVWDWFITKGNSQASHGLKCQYRTPNGNKCAVGVLIPDELYDKKMEGSDLADVVEFPGVYEILKGVDRRLLRDLQTAHDFQFATLGHELAMIAKDFNLTIPEENAND